MKLISIMQLKLNLSERQRSRLRNGHSIQIKPEQVGSGMPLHVNPMLHKKIMSAHRRGKGSRLQLSGSEIEASGLKETLQKAAKFYKEKIRPVAAPYLKRGAKRLLNVGKEALNTATLGALEPELQSLYDRYGDKAVEVLGRVSGAYGFKGGAVIPFAPLLSDQAPMAKRKQISRRLKPPGEPSSSGGSFRVI